MGMILLNQGNSFKDI